jgi:cyclic pyranopterin phosphate synthase
MCGVNDQEIESIVDFCGTQGFILRLIETMPVGEAGRRALDHYLPLDEAATVPAARRSPPISWAA